MKFLRWLLSTSFAKAFATGEARHLATMAAGAIGTWLLSHGGNQSDVANITQGLTALIIGAAGYGMSRVTASGNEARVQVAAQTGAVIPAPLAKKLVDQGVVAQRTADQAQADKTAAAIAAADATAPSTKAALLADLAAGGPK